jgi:hypothetical protein
MSNDVDDEPDDESWGYNEGECAGCEAYGRIDDVGLCAQCAAKLDRDLIRQRDWDYSAMAFMVPDEARENLRRRVIEQYGEELELIAPEKRIPPRRSGRRRKGREAK